MKRNQKGFGGLQVLLSVGVIVAVSFVAVPAYSSFMSKAKITEAMTMAGESKRKAAEFMTLNGRLPQTHSEAEMMMTTTVTAPEYVRDMAVIVDDPDNDIVIKVFLKHGVVENTTGKEQYIYMAGGESASSGYLEWNCGASGIDAELLPEDCQS